MIRKTVYLAVTAAMLAVSGVSFAQASHNGDMRGDRRELRQDRHDLRGDRRDMRQDRHALRHDLRTGNRAGARAQRRDLRGDRHDFRADRHDMRGDRRDLRGDRHAMHVARNGRR